MDRDPVEWPAMAQQQVTDAIAIIT